MFVLILTIILSDHPITAIQGFTSLESCMAAGTVWLRESKSGLHSGNRYNIEHQVSAVCAKQ